MTRTYRIVTSYFVAGVDVDSRDRVVFVAPILNYMRGWTLARVRQYVAAKGWTGALLE